MPGSRIGEGRLGTAAIRAVVKRRAAQAGITRHVSGHSLRIGAALSLAERNVSVAEMQREGRWKSPSMPGYYVRNQEASRGAVARLRGGAEETHTRKVAEIAYIPQNSGASVD